MKAYFMIIKSAMEFLDDKDICPWNDENSGTSATETNITHLIQPIITAELFDEDIINMQDEDFIDSMKSFCNNYSLEQAFLNIEVSQKRHSSFIAQRSIPLSTLCPWSRPPKVREPSLEVIEGMKKALQASSFRPSRNLPAADDANHWMEQAEDVPAFGTMQ